MVLSHLTFLSWLLHVTRTSSMGTTHMAVTEAPLLWACSTVTSGNRPWNCTQRMQSLDSRSGIFNGMPSALFCVYVMRHVPVMW